MTQIVFLDRSALSGTAKLRSSSHRLEWTEHTQSTPENVIEHCADAEILVLSKVPIGEAVLAACPRIKHIAVAATGYNVVDLQACAKHGVSVSNIPNYAARTVAEHVITVALVLRRELIQYRQKVIEGAWQNSVGFCLFDKPLNDIENATLGIVGLGEIGQKTALMAHALGMQVVFSARKESDSKLTRAGIARQVPFTELLSNSDIISLHCDLNESTQNLIGRAELAQMQKHAILINTARGGIVDEAALVEAVETEQIGAIAFDVLLQEPPEDNSPLLQIAERSNVIITPHMSWTSLQSMQALTNILMDNIEGYLNGTPQNLVR